MRYDPQKHHRRSIRLKGYDYTQAGAYFITIVTKDRACLFGRIVDGEMRLSHVGHIVRACWLAIPDHFPHAMVDEFVVMPNHVHGIIVLNETEHVGARHAVPRLQAMMYCRSASRNAPEAVASPGKYGCQRSAGIGEIGEHHIGGVRAQFFDAKRTGCNRHGARTDSACACNVVWRVSYDNNVGSGEDTSIAPGSALCRDQGKIRAARTVAAVCAALEVEKLNQTHHAQFEARHRRKIPGQQ